MENCKGFFLLHLNKAWGSGEGEREILYVSSSRHRSLSVSLRKAFDSLAGQGSGFFCGLSARPSHKSVKSCRIPALLRQQMSGPERGSRRPQQPLMGKRRQASRCREELCEKQRRRLVCRDCRGRSSPAFPGARWEPRRGLKARRTSQLPTSRAAVEGTLETYASQRGTPVLKALACPQVPPVGLPRVSLGSRGSPELLVKVDLRTFLFGLKESSLPRGVGVQAGRQTGR